MADAHAKHHDYHLVNPSPWPFVGSVSAFVMALGAIGWMHTMFPGASIVFFAGLPPMRKAVIPVVPLAIAAALAALYSFR